MHINRKSRSVSLFILASGFFGDFTAAAQDGSIPLAIASATTVPMGKCNTIDGIVRRNMVIGLVRIKMPRRLDLSDVDRLVKYMPGNTNPIADDKEVEDDIGVKNKDKGVQKQPFNVYLLQHNLGQVPAGTVMRFLAVKIIIREDSNFTFYDEGSLGIRGVGAGSDDAKMWLCGNELKGEDADFGDRQVATFYVDLTKAIPPEGVPFNIGVKPRNHAQTPIFIDPKVKNEG